MNATLTPCTAKQVSFIATLCQQRDTTSVEASVVAARGSVMSQTLSKKAASDLINLLLAQPRVESKATSKEEPADGIYLDETDDGDVVYKVYKMVHGSGRQGVKRLDITFADGKATGSFTYLGLAAKHLPTSAAKMPLEKAQEFGRIYGFCVKCGRTLTDEESIAAGIGPVCAGKGW